MMAPSGAGKSTEYNRRKRTPLTTILARRSKKAPQLDFTFLRINNRPIDIHFRLIREAILPKIGSLMKTTNSAPLSAIRCVPRLLAKFSASLFLVALALGAPRAHAAQIAF